MMAEKYDSVTAQVFFSHYHNNTKTTWNIHSITHITVTTK